MKSRDVLTILYGLHIIWTGLLRNIEAAAYKPNALWFCLVMGLIAIAAGFLFRKGLNRTATIVGLLATAVIFCFYFREFICEPETEATYRVGSIILSSIAEFVVLLLPSSCENFCEGPTASISRAHDSESRVT